ncbi:hypothetical protein J2X63_002280 [Agromyces sp. 3263]|uniref:DUF1214 domain-containing protein n=1 Tax=Agromyces sp. 3263 TaxID=2817750 RepID=UPI0028667FA9|nr:DUF1254 domain-containing protein [Agromyces sp. 3263]MDR6906594.1 hypothetical protein [Agromyces sp. 3263]
MTISVDNENFVRAETDRMLAGLQAAAGGVNRWNHYREPTPIDKQTIIRMNRDTLYSLAVVDASKGVTLTVPESGERYVSVMVIDEDHYVKRIFHAAGTYTLTADEIGTPYAALGARVLLDGTDPGDLERVHAIQDGFAIDAPSNEPFVMPDYDEESFTGTRQAILAEVQRVGLDSGTHGMFGDKDDVDPRQHLLGTAAGWGGLPETEAFYVSEEPHLPVGEYHLTVKDVPVDAFWSISLYNSAGFFEENPLGAYSVNNINGVKNHDGSITVRFGGDGSLPNTLPLTDGWNYLVRMYRPRPEVLDGSWTFPKIAPV